MEDLLLLVWEDFITEEGILQPLLNFMGQITSCCAKKQQCDAQS